VVLLNVENRFPERGERSNTGTRHFDTLELEAEGTRIDLRYLFRAGFRWRSGLNKINL
jgi:hypothetical protein